MAMLLWPSVLANEGLGQRFCFQTLDERHVAAGEGAGNPRFPSQRVTVPALFFKTRRQLGKCDLCESRCPSTLVTLRRVHIGRRGQREPFALIRKSSGGEKSAFSRGTGPGQQVASRSRHIRPPHETLPPACEDGAGKPHVTPTATQNPGLSELGGRERALGHRRHRGGRRGLPPGHSMAHTCSSQNRTERCSQFSLFERHFGCFQWGQLRLRANMNRLRVQR